MRSGMLTLILSLFTKLFILLFPIQNWILTAIGVLAVMYLKKAHKLLLF
jgi:hypothetical protein